MASTMVVLCPPGTVVKTLWVKAPLKPVGESPSFNTWLIRPPSWVKNTTRPPGHNKTPWVKAPLNPKWVKNPQTTPPLPGNKVLWVKAKQSTVTLSGESKNQQFISHEYTNSIINRYAASSRTKH
jgi:hypothetical protein